MKPCGKGFISVDAQHERGTVNMPLKPNTPVVRANGTVYIGRHEFITALTNEGQQIWQLPYGANGITLGENGILYFVTGRVNFDITTGTSDNINYGGRYSWHPSRSIIAADGHSFASIENYRCVSC